jgi:hypothetical protein
MASIAVATPFSYRDVKKCQRALSVNLQLVSVLQLASPAQFVWDL